MYTNIALVGLIAGLAWAFGLGTYLLIQTIVLVVAGAAGIWLFYVQHQFEDAYWEQSEDWNYVAAAMRGSSFYKLPRVLQWLSGNIGFHHIHHLSPRVPNYNLEKCHDEEPAFQAVQAVTLWGSLRSLTFRLWDERQRRLVGYRRPRYDPTA